MAGDWIKVEHATPDKPEVMRAAEMLGIGRDEMVGVLIRYFVWLDKHLSRLCPDSVPHVSRKSLDDCMHVTGLAATLESIGWAKFDDANWSLSVNNADHHNGNSAKSRASEQKKKGRQRADQANSVPVVSRLCPDDTGTREEKRREDIKSKAKTNPLPPLSQALPAPGCPAGVTTEVWEIWKRQRGRKLTADAVRLQTRFLKEEGLRGSDPNAIIEQSIRNGWAGLFALKTGAAVNGGGNVALHEKRSATAKAMYGDNVGSIGATGGFIEGHLSRETD